MPDSILRCHCECGAMNLVYMGDPQDMTAPDYYFFECWSCKKCQPIDDDETIREILMLDADADLMAEAPGYWLPAYTAQGQKP